MTNNEIEAGNLLSWIGVVLLCAAAVMDREDRARNKVDTSKRESPQGELRFYDSNSHDAGNKGKI